MAFSLKPFMVRVGTCNVAAKFIGESPYVLPAFSNPFAAAYDSYAAKEDFGIADFTFPTHPFWSQSKNSFSPMYAHASASGVSKSGSAGKRERSSERLEAASEESSNSDVISPDIRPFEMDIAHGRWNSAVGGCHAVFERSRSEGLRAMEAALVRHIQNHGADDVPIEFIIDVTGGIPPEIGYDVDGNQRMITPETELLQSAIVFEALLEAKAWEKAKQVVSRFEGLSQVYYAYHHQRAYAQLRPTLVKFIEKNGAQSVPPDVILQAETSRGGYVSETKVFFGALLQLEAWDEVQTVLTHAARKFSYEAKIALDAMLVEHLKSQPEGAIPEEVISAAASLEGAFGSAVAEFNSQLQKGQWRQINRTLSRTFRRAEEPLPLINALSDFLSRHGDNSVPTYVLATASILPGAKGGPFFAALLRLGEWEQAEQALAAAPERLQVTNKTTITNVDMGIKVALERALYQHIDQFGDELVPPSLLERALSHNAADILNPLFASLLHKKAWNEVRRVLVYPNRNSWAPESFAEVLGEHIDKHGERRVPPYVLRAAAALSAGSGLRFFNALMERDEWEEVYFLLTVADDEGSPASSLNERVDGETRGRMFNALARFISQLQIDRIPKNVLEAAVDRFGFFKTLLERDIWEGTKGFLDKIGGVSSDAFTKLLSRADADEARALHRYALDLSAQDSQRPLADSLDDYIEEHGAEAVAANTIAAVIKFGEASPETESKYFRMLFDRGEWDAAKNTNRHKRIKLSYLSSVADYIEDHGEGAVPPEIIQDASCGFADRYSIRGHSEEGVGDIIHHSPKGALALLGPAMKTGEWEAGGNLEKYVRMHGISELDTDLIADAIKLRGVGSAGRAELFKELLARGEWDQAEQVMEHFNELDRNDRVLGSDVHQFISAARRTMAKAFDSHIEEHGFGSVPPNVINAAHDARIDSNYVQHEHMKNLLAQGSWDEAKEYLTNTWGQDDHKISSRVAAVVDYVEDHGEDSVPADMLKQAGNRLVGVRHAYYEKWSPYRNGTLEGFRILLKHADMVSDNQAYQAATEILDNFVKRCIDHSMVGRRATIALNAIADIKAHRDTRFNLLSYRDLQVQLVEYMDEHGEASVPAPLIEAAVLTSGHMEVSDFFNILLRQGKWKQVERVMGKIGEDHRWKVATALEEYIAENGHIKVPDSVLRTAIEMERYGSTIFKSILRERGKK